MLVAAVVVEETLLLLVLVALAVVEQVEAQGWHKMVLALLEIQVVVEVELLVAHLYNLTAVTAALAS